MYGFILNMWVLKRIAATKVQSYVSTYISQQEADNILVTPQTGYLSQEQ